MVEIKFSQDRQIFYEKCVKRTVEILPPAYNKQTNYLILRSIHCSIFSYFVLVFFCEALAVDHWLLDKFTGYAINMKKKLYKYRSRMIFTSIIKKFEKKNKNFRDFRV